MKNPKIIQTTHRTNAGAAWLTRVFEQDVIEARARYEQQMHREINGGSDESNLQALTDQEVALLTLQAAENRLAIHIRDLQRAAAAAQTSGDEEQADAIREEGNRAARLLASRRKETPEEAMERLRVVQQTVTNGRRFSEDSTDILRHLREGRYADE